VPLQDAGVQINPIWNMSDERFSEVIFNGAFVSAANVVGPLNRGWQLINAALSLERTGLDFYVKVRRWLDMVLDRARATGQINDPGIGQQLAKLQAQVEVGKLLAWRIISQQTRDELDVVASAMSKWYNTEIARAVTRLSLEMEGLEGILSRWDAEAPMSGVLEAAHRESPGLTIAAGTSEIMLYLISASLLQPSQ
jgi:alkylation response protein AidB-like acyl-CoA dehydrogenase